jgi:hypothetical protein
LRSSGQPFKQSGILQSPPYCFPVCKKEKYDDEKKDSPKDKAQRLFPFIGPAAG